MEKALECNAFDFQRMSTIRTELPCSRCFARPTDDRYRLNLHEPKLSIF